MERTSLGDIITRGIWPTNNHDFILYASSMSRVIRELLEAVFLALLVFFVIQLSVQNFRVEGHSMQPTLDGDEYLMVNKLSYFRVDLQRLAKLVPFWDVEDNQRAYLPFAHPPKRGDVVVFHAPTQQGKDFVKRVIGLPGERVEIKAGKVYINGDPLAEPYLTQSYPDLSMDCIPKLNRRSCTLQEKQYFVLGDNRRNSNDSRDWGPVSSEAIIGKVWFVYWPLSRLPLPFLGTLGGLR